LFSLLSPGHNPRGQLCVKFSAAGMLVARALPAGLGASSKMYTLFPDGP